MFVYKSESSESESVPPGTSDGLFEVVYQGSKLTIG